VQISKLKSDSSSLEKAGMLIGIIERLLIFFLVIIGKFEAIGLLIAAKSLLTGKDEPLAWSYNYGKGRVFQSLLGHSAKTYEAWEAGEMLRRATAWAAGKEVHENQPAGQPK
jgi:hypothetical protein